MPSFLNFDIFWRKKGFLFVNCRGKRGVLKRGSWAFAFEFELGDFKIFLFQLFAAEKEGSISIIITLLSQSITVSFVFDTFISKGFSAKKK